VQYRAKLGDGIRRMINKSDRDLWTDTGVIEGQRLRLEPMDLRHLDDLSKHLLYPGAWHMDLWAIRTKADMEQRILSRSINARADGTGCGFAFIEKDSDRAVGMSYFMNLNRANNFLEIGGTWIGKEWQKTFVNTEAKLLMLGYAFETIGCQRVEFRVDALNFNSQRAVKRLGAKFEGELRQSCRLPDGRKRDYQVFSILDSEWANIKQTLIWYLSK
jgi:N-acetyltransferase